ncbi:hypothetical protein Tco_1205857, partial [Tanacetum coccineum]
WDVVETQKTPFGATPQVVALSLDGNVLLILCIGRERFIDIDILSFCHKYVPYLNTNLFAKVPIQTHKRPFVEEKFALKSDIAHDCMHEGAGISTFILRNVLEGANIVTRK